MDEVFKIILTCNGRQLDKKFYESEKTYLKYLKIKNQRHAYIPSYITTGYKYVIDKWVEHKN